MGIPATKDEGKFSIKKKNSHFEDGYLFHAAYNVGKLVNTDRLKLAIPILEALGAKVDDIVTISTVKNNPNALFLSVIPQEKIETIDIDQERIDMFKQEILEENPGWWTDNANVEGISIIMRIKSQMRIGTKSEIEKMMEEIDAKSGDYIALQYCADPQGWYLLRIKEENIPNIYLPTGADMIDETIKEDHECK